MSPDAGFHPVSFTLWQDEADATGNNDNARYLQSRFTASTCRKRSRKPYYRGDKMNRLKELHLRGCVLNRPIDASQFSYAGTGIEGRGS